MRNKITVKKLIISELESLQQEIHVFITYLIQIEYHVETTFLNAIMTVDILGQLFYKLRNKIENRQQFYRINFSMAEAASILKCCNYDNPDRSIYNRNVLTKFNLELDQKLKSV